MLETLALPLLSNTSFTGTNRPEAYDAYLAGLRRAATYNIVDLALAMDDFQRAIDLDPEYVLAYVALAETIEVVLAIQATRGRRGKGPGRTRQIGARCRPGDGA